MLRTCTLALLLLTIGCATTEPMTEPMVVDSHPAPMAEMARVDTTSGDAASSARSSPAAMVFERSDSIAHRYTDARGRRMHVVFRVSLGLPADQTAVAGAQLQANWDSARQQALLVCEQADLTTEPGTERCEQQLCETITRALFAKTPATSDARAVRVMWQRLTWD